MKVDELIMKVFGLGNSKKSVSRLLTKKPTSHWVNKLSVAGSIASIFSIALPIYSGYVTFPTGVETVEQAKAFIANDKIDYVESKNLKAKQGINNISDNMVNSVNLSANSSNNVVSLNSSNHTTHSNRTIN